MVQSDPASTGKGQWRLIVACMAAYNMANLLLWLQPALVAEMIASDGLSESHAGAVITLAMLVEAVILLAAGRWRRSFVYFPAAMAGLLIVALCCFGWLATSGFAARLSFLGAAAVGFGLLMLVPSIALAGVDRPATTFGRMYSLNLIFSSGLLLILPQIGAFVGHSSAISAMLIVAAITLPLLLLMPRRAMMPPHIPEPGRGLSAQGKAIGLLAIGVAAVGLAYGQVWAFFMVLGQDAGLSANEASSASGASLIGALAGSLLAGFFGTLLKPRRMLILSVIGIGASLLMLIMASTPLIFVTGGMLAMFFMYVFFPTILGVAATLDPSGRGIAIINGALALLAAIGPMVAGLLISGSGKSSLVPVTAVSAAIAITAFLMALRSHSSPPQQPVPAA